MQILKDPITIAQLSMLGKNRFGNLVKAVVDIEKGIMALDGELHADEEATLIESGSQQKDLWGINLYPELWGSDGFIGFDSMINLKPSQGNKTRGVDNPQIQQKIQSIVSKLIKP